MDFFVDNLGSNVQEVRMSNMIKAVVLHFGGGRCHDGFEFPVVTPVCGVGGIGSPVLGLKDGCGGVSSAEEVAWVSGL